MLMKYSVNHLVIFNNNSIGSFNFIQISSQLHKFINIMESLSLSSEEDNLQWTLTSNNIFSVKSCYGFLNDGGLRSQFMNSIWKCSAPLKIEVFAWLVTHDKIFSKANFLRKGWTGPPHCVFCGHDMETISHIFLHCSVSLAVCDFFLNNTDCLNTIRIYDIFSLFSLVKFNLNLKGWNMLVLAILWWLWLNRNSMIFRNQGRSLSLILFQILQLMTC